ncbi:hypothetical protein G9F71_013605 [Clostridium sp. FP2]|uniref:hypothetical protein n=1 Tax=Clostridium TaxID=1485 RepID=UPI0013E99DA6|nr:MULTISPECIES: hypothetical protein [Clostridium]MBW9157806.1 hypothetical protein [Clostridium tagluense]MBZ9623883.1 hypothetical protein [Clostridium sp. FP2]WLC63781.1 hypothetical protein KTC93_12890 [Clostridium tagluense]
MAFSTIPIPIYVLLISLMGLILLSIFNKKLKLRTVTVIIYILVITTIIGIIPLFFME